VIARPRPDDDDDGDVDEDLGRDDIED